MYASVYSLQFVIRLFMRRFARRIDRPTRRSAAQRRLDESHVIVTILDVDSYLSLKKEVLYGTTKPLILLGSPVTGEIFR